MLRELLGQKIAHNLKDQLQREQTAENQLLHEEKQLEKAMYKREGLDSPTIQKIGFVPDHLGFGCSEGVEIYQITVQPYQTTYAVMKQM